MIPLNGKEAGRKRLLLKGEMVIFQPFKERSLVMKRKVTLYSLMVSALLIGCFCGQALSQTPGVTDKEITIGVLTDLTGPASIYGQASVVGTRVAFNEINRKGGIHGRELKAVVEDHQWNPARAVAGYKYLVDRVGVFLLGVNIGTAASLAVMDFLKEDRLPMIPVTWAKGTYEPFNRYAFPTVTSYQNQMGVLIDYVMETLKPKSPKFGLIYVQDDYGKEVSEGVMQGLAYYGLKAHHMEPFGRTNVDFSSQVMNLKRAGCDYVVLGTTLGQATNILKEAARIDYRPQFLGAPGPTDAMTIQLTGELMPADMLGVHCMAGWNEDTPGMAKLRALTAQDYPELAGKTQNFFTQWCYANALVYAEGIRRAGRDLTREGFVNAMETIKDFDTDGILPKISYGPQQREPAYTARVMKADLEKKDFVPVTDWSMPKFLKK